LLFWDVQLGLCKMVEFGLDIFEIFENPYNLPHLVIIHTRPVSWIFVFYMWCWTGKFVKDVLEMRKESVMACFKVLSKHLPGTVKEHNENFQSRCIEPKSIGSKTSVLPHQVLAVNPTSNIVHYT
jgi:hypothetical protein